MLGDGDGFLEAAIAEREARPRHLGGRLAPGRAIPGAAEFQAESAGDLQLTCLGRAVGGAAFVSGSPGERIKGANWLSISTSGLGLER